MEAFLANIELKKDIEMDWDNAPEELLDLRGHFFTFDKIDRELLLSLSPKDFGITFLTSNETTTSTRGHALMVILKTIYDEDSFWHVDNTNTNDNETILQKCASACRHWGIEKNAMVVAGKCSIMENLWFWTNVFESIRSLSSNTTKAKRMLEIDLPDTEDDVSWEEIIANGLNEVLSDNNTLCIRMTDVMNLENLYRNGMTSTTFMHKIRKGVTQALKNLGHPEQYLLQKSQKACAELRQKGEFIFEISKKYINFLDFHHNFSKTKTEFLLFHTQMAMDLMTEVLQLHRSFLLGITQDDSTDDPEKEKVFSPLIYL